MDIVKAISNFIFQLGFSFPVNFGTANYLTSSENECFLMLQHSKSTCVFTKNDVSTNFSSSPSWSDIFKALDNLKVFPLCGEKQDSRWA